MKIHASKSDLKKWIKCVPTEGDLFFFDDACLKKIKKNSVTILSPAKAKDPAMQIWDLNSRSWYGYSLNNSKACAWMPPGMMATLEKSLLNEIIKCQIRMGVPSFIKTTLLPKSVQKLLPQFGKYSWANAEDWAKLSTPQKATVLHGWFVQNEIVSYKSYNFRSLPIEAKNEIRRLNIKHLLNSFESSSGPNCMGLVAGAISSKEDRVSLIKTWLHEKPFLNTLRQEKFSPIKDLHPQARDVLVFKAQNKVVHAAYCIDAEFYIEKPGQDFYEPYRISKFKKWNTEWPETTLTIWRRAKI
ncbi:hypothetical protein [Bdellovibrio bacteriovorus]|nr:hypothetical protein [Bdellovibrio bacteriovorus]